MTAASRTQLSSSIRRFLRAPSFTRHGDSGCTGYCAAGIYVSVYHPHELTQNMRLRITMGDWENDVWIDRPTEGAVAMIPDPRPLLEAILAGFGSTGRLPRTRRLSEIRSCALQVAAYGREQPGPSLLYVASGSTLNHPSIRPNDAITSTYAAGTLAALDALADSYWTGPAQLLWTRSLSSFHFTASRLALPYEAPTDPIETLRLSSYVRRSLDALLGEERGCSIYEAIQK